MSTTLDVHGLLAMPPQELDDLFRSVSDPGPVPAGEGEGTVLFAPGQPISETAARLTHLVAWKGKVFDPEHGQLRNEIGPLGTRAVRAAVDLGPSWLDGRPAIVLDYSRTSLLAHWVRDEIRQVAPGLYLGIVYWGQEREPILRFALQFPV
jgi:hypothetical protein